MSSKSSGSIVKSVESVVKSVMPKNMNMKHVLLAVLVGLLLCMLMGNTIEGFNMFTISGDSGSETIDTGDSPAIGFCRTGSTALMQRSCVPSPGSIADAVGDASTLPGKHAAMGNVCSSREVSNVGGCTGTSQAPGERSGPFIVQKMTEANLDPAVDNLECTLGDEIDECAKDSFNSDSTGTACTSPAGQALGCKWEDCKFTGDNTMMMGADNSNADEASIVLDLKDPFLPEYDRWRKCLFGNKNAVLNTTPTTQVPDMLQSGQFPTNSGAAGSWTATAAPATAAGTPVSGLDDWVTGHAGYPRTVPSMKNQELTPTVLQNINAIPMTSDGKVSTDLGDHIPPKWKTGFENMYNYCKSENPNEFAAIGWSPDFRSLQCLNWNPAHKKINITTQKARHPCGPCLGDCKDGKDYSHERPNKAASIINCDGSLGERATAMAKLATVGNYAAVKDGGTEIATNLLKAIL